jgi:xylulokinase
MKGVLAYDIGGTSLRAALITPSGEALAIASVTLPPLQMNASGFSEADPQQWWESLCKATAALFAGPETAGFEVAGLALSGLTRTQIFLDREGKAVRQAMTWADARATAQTDRIIQAQARMGTRGKIFGPVNAFHPLARVLWVKEQEPERFERVSTVLEPKDYVNFLLTGERAGDKLSLSRIMTVLENSLAWRLLEEIGIPKEIFPDLRNPWDQLGSVIAGLEPPMDRLAGVPVFVGAMDAWCGALGIGAVRAGRAFNASGTSEVFGVATEAFQEIAGLVTQPWGKGLFLTGGPSQAGADCLAWYIEASGGEDQDLKPGTVLKDLEGLARQPEPVLFLPYLRGERVPLWKPDARGLFLGLNRRHRRVDFIWAILEGVAFSNRQVLELATKGRQEVVKEVRITGGAVESNAWCQTKADVLGLPLVRTQGNEAAVRGAAMVALIGLGHYADITECQERLVRPERVFEPRKERAGFYDRLFQRWIEAQEGLLPLTEALTRDVREGFGAEFETAGRKDG